MQAALVAMRAHGIFSSLPDVVNVGGRNSCQQTDAKFQGYIGKYFVFIITGTVLRGNLAASTGQVLDIGRDSSATWGSRQPAAISAISNQRHQPSAPSAISHQPSTPASPATKVFGQITCQSRSCQNVHPPIVGHWQLIP
jgi:hypothetical protein